MHLNDYNVISLMQSIDNLHEGRIHADRHLILTSVYVCQIMFLLQQLCTQYLILTCIMSTYQGRLKLGSVCVQNTCQVGRTAV